MQTPIRILFLCTGNSCRSIIAEALVNHLGADRVRAGSAGSRPTGSVHPRALEVLEGQGMGPRQPWSKSLDDPALEEPDLVITVCDNAAGEACPVWLSDTPKVHWGIPDPAAAHGGEGEIRDVFEQCFRRLEIRVRELLALPLEQLSARELAEKADEIHRRA